MEQQPFNPDERPEDEVANGVEDIAMHVVANDGGQRREEEGEKGAHNERI
jgi:hypothetical protein